jgi:hypothetical protein
MLLVREEDSRLCGTSSDSLVHSPHWEAIQNKANVELVSSVSTEIVGKPQADGCAEDFMDDALVPRIVVCAWSPDLYEVSDKNRGTLLRQPWNIKPEGNPNKPGKNGVRKYKDDL